MATFDSGGGGSEEDDQQEDQERDVVAGEGGTQDPAGAADELAGRDPGSGGGGGGAGGGRTRDPRQQADEQLTQRDPGSSGAGGRGGAGGGAAGGSAAEEELTQRDPGSSQASRGGAGAADSTTQQTERAFVERQIDATLQEGVEGGAGGGRRQEAAREFEREIVEQSDRVDDPSDVAIVERDGKLEAELSRSAQVDMTVEEFDLKEELVRGFKRDRRPKGQGLTPGGAVPPVAEGIDVGDIEEVTMDDAGELDVTFSEDFIDEMKPVEAPDAEPVEADTSGAEPARPLTERAADLAGDVREEGFSSVERGGALSEAARNNLAKFANLQGERPEDFAKYTSLEEERIEKYSDYTISGPGATAIGFNTPGVLPVEFESGDPGTVNEDVLSSLTEGEGALSDEQRADIEQDIEQRQELLDFGDELGGFVGDVTGDERAAGVATGVGRLLGDFASVTAEATLLGDKAIEVAPNLPGTVGEFGGPEVAATSLEVGGRGTSRVFEGASEKPYEFTGSLTGAVVGGAAAGKVIRGAPGRVRGATIRTRGGSIYDLDDLSTPPTTTRSGLPGFTRRAQRDPDFAAREFTEQAKKGPLAQSGRGVDVDVRIDPDSPPVTLGPELSGTIRGAPGAVGQRIVGAGAAARRLPGQSLQRLDEAAFTAGQRTGRRFGDLDDAAFQTGVRTGKRVTDAEDFLRELPDAIDDAAFRSGVRAGEQIKQIEDLIGGATAPSARQLAEGAVGRLDDAAFRGGVRFGEGLGALDDAAFRGGARFGERLGDLDAAAFTTGERLGRGTRRLQNLPSALDDAAFGAGVRTGKRVTDAEEFLKGLPGAVDDAAFEAGRRTGERLGAVDDAAFRAGVRTGEKVGEIEDLIERVPTSLEDVDDVAFAAGRRTGERLGELDAAAFQTGGRLGERLGEIDAAAFRAGETVGATTRQLQDLPETLDDAAFAAGRRTGEQLGDLDGAAFRGGVRVGEASRQLEDLPGRVRSGVDAELQNLDDAAFQAGVKTGETIRRVEDFDPSDLKDLTVEVDLTTPDATPVAFHGRDPDDVADYGGFGKEFEAPEGSSEIPGLFQAADLSPLRITEAGESGGLSIPRVGVPTSRVRTSRVLAEEDIDVDVAEGRTRQDVAEFLEGEASREKSFIRTDSGGGPTGEQEVIAPPGATFVESGGKFGVRVGGTKIPFTDISVGGEIIPGRLTQRVESDVELDDLPGESLTATEVATETTEAITSTKRAVETEPTPFAPVSPTTPTATDSSVDVTEDVDPVASITEDVDVTVSDSILPSSPSGTGSLPGSGSPTPTGGSGTSGPPSTTFPPTSPPSPPSSPGSPPPPTETPPPPTVTDTPPGPPDIPETPPPPPPVEVLPDFGKRKKKTREPEFEFFRREFIAPVEENPLQAIDEDLGSFDGLGDLDDLDPF